jgi:hypothetical protein
MKSRSRRDAKPELAASLKLLIWYVAGLVVQAPKVNDGHSVEADSGLNFITGRGELSVCA